MSPLAHGIARLAGVSGDDCAEYMWRGLYAGQKGWFRRDRHGEDVGTKNLHSSEESRQKLWEHTLEETSR